MFQRSVSYLLMFGLLAGQLAAVPHSHGMASAEEQREHDAVPHIHLDWLWGSHHDHGHGPPGPSHSQNVFDSTSSSESAAGQRLVTGLGGADHANAIVVAKHFFSSRTGQLDARAFGCQLSALLRIPNYFNDLRANSNSSIPWHPPDQVFGAADIYLTLRNLRI
jgi:hypothetical protein